MFSRSGQGEDCWKENTRTWSLGGRSISKGKYPDMVTWCEKYLKRKTPGHGHLVREVSQKENTRTRSLGGRSISKGKWPDMVTWWETYLKRKTPGHGHLVGEVSQKLNPLPCHPRRDCEDSRRHDKWKFYNAFINDILKDSRYPREKTPKLYNLEAKIVLQHCKWILSIIFDPQDVSLFRRKVRPFSITYKCGNGGIAHDYRHYR